MYNIKKIYLYLIFLSFYVILPYFIYFNVHLVLIYGE